MFQISTESTIEFWFLFTKSLDHGPWLRAGDHLMLKMGSKVDLVNCRQETSCCNGNLDPLEKIDGLFTSCKGGSCIWSWERRTMMVWNGLDFSPLCLVKTRKKMRKNNDDLKRIRLFSTVSLSWRFKGRGQQISERAVRNFLKERSPPPSFVETWRTVSEKVKWGQKIHLIHICRVCMSTLRGIAFKKVWLLSRISFSFFRKHGFDWMLQLKILFVGMHQVLKIILTNRFHWGCLHTDV